VEGCVHGSPEEVLEAVGVETGRDITDADTVEQIRDDIRAIHRLDFVGDVTAKGEAVSDGIRLIYIIDENPLITDIRFTGNRKFKTDVLQRKLDFKKPVWIFGRKTEAMYYSPQTAQKLRQQILDLYAEKGFPNTDITYEWEDTGDKEGILTFQMREGKKLKVRKVRFNGVTAFKPKFLQKRIRTRKGWWFFTRSFDDDEFEIDLLRIEQAYKEHGYLNARATRGRFQVSEDGKGLIVVIDVEEGVQFRVGSIEIVGNSVFTTGEIYDTVQTSTGEICNWVVFNEDLRRIVDLYRGQGFLRSYVDYRMVRREEDAEVDIQFMIVEGQRIYLGDVLIRGVATIGEKGDIEPVPLKTRDYVILREIKLESGEVLDWDRVREAERNLINLRYFQLDPDLEPVERRLLYGFSHQRTDDPTIEDLVLTAEEAQTGSISFGLGYNTTYGPSVFTQVSEMNLFGRGQRARLFAEVGERRNQGSLSWTEPHFLDSEYLLGVDLFYLEREAFGGRDFDERRMGVGVRVGRDLTEDIDGWVRYKIEKVEISEIDDPREVIIKRPALYEDSTLTTSSVTFGIRRDTRDYFFFPTSGSDLQLSAEFAGLGGDTEFIKLLSDASWYQRLTTKLILALNLQLGAAFSFDPDDLPLQERFFLGGANSVRGFDEGGIGPREDFIRGFLDEEGMLLVDPTTGEIILDRDRVNIGGESFSEGHLELRYRLVQNLDLVGFLDAGTAGREVNDIFSDFRVSTGAGIRITVPVLGAGATIRLDYGIPLIEKDEDDTENFHFSFGQQF
jgi:outer membrane protein insertion porin family